eukprot:TRINITY_DN8703_c0_g1_i2.p1 TRINITY_DN8703_c0_g1~~TRINITY_DN8703_c0_g1_i2.p1  ORF type:complete len:520 (-),score=94.84 TRINITY_DN8703_c0_g1_i2:63-1622(-)
MRPQKSSSAGTVFVSSLLVVCFVANNSVSAWLPDRWPGNILGRRYKTSSVRHANAGDQDGIPGLEKWRDFRAKLVRAEPSGKITTKVDEGWAYVSPLIEQGSVLLSAPNQRFSFLQHYFHKAVILIIRHSANGDIGLILNRPTDLTTQDVDLAFSDLPQDQLLKAFGLSSGSEPWRVRFGGDCQGLKRQDKPQEERTVWDSINGLIKQTAQQTRYFCLHTVDRLSHVSETVIDGMYLIDLSHARMLAQAGEADKDDFIIIVGYCGWGPGQLQAELDRGRSWTLVAADQKALLRALWDGGASGGAERPDGISQWQSLFDMANPGISSREAGCLEEEDDDLDGIVQHWMETRGLLATAVPHPQVLASVPSAVKQGTFTARLGGPAQYLHKGVLIVSKMTDRGATLILLNGPKIGVAKSGGDVCFGGTGESSLRSGTLFSVPDGLILGCLKIPKEAFEELIRLGAFELSSISLSELFTYPRQLRWAAAGGTLNTIRQAGLAALGDKVMYRWYEEFLGQVIWE